MSAQLLRFVAVLLVSAFGAAPAYATPAAAAGGPRTVLAYYYAWWDEGNFGRTMYKPGEAYNSDDRGVMQRHVQQAQAAGIGGFVMSWYGNGDRTDTNLQHLLDVGAQSGFQATIHFETPKFWGAEDTIAQLKAFYDTRINHPAMLRYQGRPVIFFWRASTYSNATWNEIRNQVDPGRQAVWIADGDNFSILSGEAW